MRRVTRDKVVFLTYDPAFRGFWLLASGFWLLASGFWLLASSLLIIFQFLYL